MEESRKYLVIIILFLFVITLSVSFSYFGANIVSKDLKETKVITGKIDLRVDDETLNAKDIAPIYDMDYDKLAYKKSFRVTSSSDSLNSCAKILLNVNDISLPLSSEYFKYKIVSDDVNKDGSFKNAKKGGKMVLANNVFIEGNQNKDFTLYIWISYADNVNQMDMLGTYMDANIEVEGKDAKDKSFCK